MKLGIFQFSPERTNKAANLRHIESVLKQHEDVDLWILPELCTTGYMIESREEINSLAEPFPGGQTADFFSALSDKLNCAIIAGVAELDGNSVYNSAAVFNQGKMDGIYRKIHLFDEEKKWFQPGDKEPKIFEINGVPVGVMICFDWIFPETARILALKGTQLIAHCANLVLPWCQSAMITRSLENHVFTATANRIGTESVNNQTLTFTGASQIVAPDGVRLGQLSTDSEEVLKIEINPNISDNKDINSNNNLFGDRRTALYSTIQEKVSL